MHRPGLTRGNGDSLRRRPYPPECQLCPQKEGVQRLRRHTTVKQSVEVPEWDMRKLKLKDRNLGPVVEWLRQISKRPAWETVLGESPTIENKVA